MSVLSGSKYEWSFLTEDRPRHLGRSMDLGQLWEPSHSSSPGVNNTGPEQGRMVAWGNTRFVRMGTSETHASKGLAKTTILTPLCTAFLRSVVPIVPCHLAWPSREKRVWLSITRDEEEAVFSVIHHERDPRWQFGEEGVAAESMHPHSHICLIPGDVSCLICT